jgi:hypothetical protein
MERSSSYKEILELIAMLHPSSAPAGAASENAHLAGVAVTPASISFQCA